MTGTAVTLDEFFEGRTRASTIFESLRAHLEAIGPSDMRVTKSQIAFSRRAGFAYVWTPDRYLRGERPPLVLSIALRRRDDSPRWKQVVEPSPGRFMHHLELHSAVDIDAEVTAWLREAWCGAVSVASRSENSGSPMPVIRTEKHRGR